MTEDTGSNGGMVDAFAALLEQQAQAAQQLFGQFSAPASESGVNAGADEWLDAASGLQKLWLGHLQEQAAQLGDWQEIAAKGAPIWSEFAERLKPAEHREDKRFADPAWREQPFFDLLHQTYLMLAEQLTALADSADTIAPDKREQLRFAIDMAADALSPANFALSNPVALNKAIETKGHAIWI